MGTPQLADDDNEDDDFSVDVSSGRPSIGLSGGRAIRPKSPVVVSLLQEHYLTKCVLMLNSFRRRLKLHHQDVHNQ